MKLFPKNNLGPGFVTANVDNDAGGIFTYSAAGARWGYLPLWTLVPITIALIVTQEMCSRMGAVTGKGLRPFDFGPCSLSEFAVFSKLPESQAANRQHK